MVIAGEASADMHGAAMLEQLATGSNPPAAFGVGGKAMRARGFEAIIGAESFSVAGLTEVILALPAMWWRMRRLVREAKRRRPAVAVLLDLPDFNLPLARRLKSLGIPVVYYISPQLWAWRRGRIKTIAKYVDRMLCILPFERDLYSDAGVSADFVGHPLVEEVPRPEDLNRLSIRKSLGLPGEESTVVALLPGSRKKEVERHLPLMLATTNELQRHYPQLEAILPVASTVERGLVERLLTEARIDVPTTVVDGQSNEALAAADVALVCSGTSTLQAALLHKPMVIVYRVSFLTYSLLRRLVKVTHIGLVNLIAGRALVPELVQGAFTPSAAATALRRLLSDQPAREKLQRELAELRQSLGKGPVAARVAGEVRAFLRSNNEPTSK